jgi:hypothetical protein
MIFSEEIKYAIKQGYKFDVKFSYKFARGKGVFKDFVETQFEIKKKQLPILLNEVLVN